MLRLVVVAPIGLFGALSLLDRVEGIANRRRVGHDEGEQVGYDGEDSKSHGFVVLITHDENVSIDHEDDR